jgi:hypothetical protein
MKLTIQANQTPSAPRPVPTRELVMWEISEGAGPGRVVPGGLHFLQVAVQGSKFEFRDVSVESLNVTLMCIKEMPS